MIELFEKDLKEQIEELSDYYKLELIHRYFKVDLSDMPINEIAQHLIDCPEDYADLVEFRPNAMDYNEYYQTYMEYAQ